MWGQIIPAVVSAGANLFGGMMSSSGQQAANAWNVASQERANAANLQWAREQYYDNVQRQEQALQTQYAFQERMSNTAYQRAMADMRAAGLNPILAYKQGSASAPGGSMPSSITTSAGQSAATVQNERSAMGKAVGQAAASAMQAAQVSTAIDLAKEQTKNQSSQADLNRANTALTTELEKKAVADTATSAAMFSKTSHEADYWKQNALNAAVQNAILGHGVTTAAGEARIKTREAEDAEKYGTGPWAQKGGFLERIGRRLIDVMDGKIPPPGGASPQANPSSGSNFWGTSEQIRKRAEENRRRYGGQ